MQQPTTSGSTTRHPFLVARNLRIKTNPRPARGFGETTKFNQFVACIKRYVLYLKIKPMLIRGKVNAARPTIGLPG